MESGLGASGLPHIGSVGDAIRSYGVKMALEGLGYRSELIAFSDDLDGFRKVPAGFPDWLNDYVAHPVTRVPDPFRCHASFGEHVGSLLRDSLDKLSISYTFMSGADAYKRGLLNEPDQAHPKQRRARRRQDQGVHGPGQVPEGLPLYPYMQELRQALHHRRHGYNAARGVVHYKCDSAEIRDKVVEGLRLRGRAERHRGRGEARLEV